MGKFATLLPCGCSLPHMASLLASALHAGVCSNDDGSRVYLVFSGSAWLELTHHATESDGELKRPAHRIEVDFPGRRELIKRDMIAPHQRLRTHGSPTFTSEFERLQECVAKSRERMVEAPHRPPPFWHKPHILAHLGLLQRLRPRLWDSIIRPDPDDDTLYWFKSAGGVSLSLDMEFGWLKVQHNMRSPQTAALLFGGTSRPSE